MFLFQLRLKLNVLILRFVFPTHKSNHPFVKVENLFQEGVSVLSLFFSKNLTDDVVSRAPLNMTTAPILKSHISSLSE